MELIDFRIESGDHVLKDHFETAAKNATYKSKTIQNEIINSIGGFIQQKIVDEVKEAGFFTVIADETPDVSRKEQMPLTLRYVDKDAVTKEKFVRFIECDKGTSAEAISAKIKEAVKDLGLDLQKVRGQGYDGASNMSGRIAGAAKLITNENILAIYVHCFAHRLNLCVADTCKQQQIKNMMENVRLVSNFFFHPKRAELLKKNIREYMPFARHELLLDVCRTRWIARIDGMDRFEEMYEVITLSLQCVRDDVDGPWSDQSRKDAGNLFVAITNFTFIMSLVVANYYLYLLWPLTSKLQQRELDIMAAYGEVDLVAFRLPEYQLSWTRTTKSCTLEPSISHLTSMLSQPNLAHVHL